MILSAKILHHADYFVRDDLPGFYWRFLMYTKFIITWLILGLGCLAWSALSAKRLADTDPEDTNGCRLYLRVLLWTLWIGGALLGMSFGGFIVSRI